MLRTCLARAATVTGALLVVSALLTACGTGSPAPTANSDQGGAASTTHPATSATPTAPHTSRPAEPTKEPKPPSHAASGPLAGMTLAQKVGQLFMTGASATGPDAATYAAISAYHVGGVTLTGRSTAGVAATAQITAKLQAARDSNDPGPLLVATDQEGGNIQVLRGPGFSRMPTALTQGTWSTARLTAEAKTWGAQLHKAGINLDLAPVMGVVPSPADNASNPPIGYYHRQYGYDDSTVISHANAFGTGMRDAGVADTIKHFPGLGHVTGNTDFTSGVTDTVTTAHGSDVHVFAAGIANHPTAVMTSTAIYAKIDPKNPGAFSHTIVTGLLRDDLGWKGLVITDDISQAKQVEAWSPAERAIKALDAGNDIVLAVNAGQIPAMTSAVIAKAKADPAFAKQVDVSARRVLAAKAAHAG